MESKLKKTSGEIIATSLTLTLKELVEENKHNLRYADLKGLTLRGLDLAYANLENAELEGADLEGTSLEGASLLGACLEGANLRGANLKDTNLKVTNLKFANLKGVKGFFRVEKGLLAKVIECALEDEDSLNMSRWHTNEYTHCIAGWACLLSKNQDLEITVGTANAAQMLLGLTNSRVFYFTKEQAIEWLNSKRQN